MDDIEFKKPKLKKKAYISETKNKVVKNFYDIKIKNSYRICSNNNALKLSVNISKNNNDFFNIIDNIALNDIKNKNKKWFNNQLSEDDLNGYFNTSICIQNNLLDLILSNTSIIKYNNNLIELNVNLKELLFKKNCLFSIKIELIGMYIYKDKIQNKWFIKELEIIDQEYNDDFQLSIEELNNEWNITLNETIIALNEELDKYNKRKNNIELFIKNNKEFINELNMYTKKDNIWEKKISILKNNIKNIINF